MIERIEDLPDGVIGFEVSGKVSAKDYETVLIPAVEAAAAHGKPMRLLYCIGPGFEGYDMGAMWEDAKVGLRHLAQWQRIAVVTDVVWIRGAMKAFGFALPAELRVFDNAALEQARRWLGE